MSGKKSWGRTVDGKELTEELIAEYVKEAEEGYDVDEMLERRRGRPPIGNGPATVESVRIDPELKQMLDERAERDGETPSAIIRDALRSYLLAG